MLSTTRKRQYPQLEGVMMLSAFLAFCVLPTSATAQHYGCLGDCDMGNGATVTVLDPVLKLNRTTNTADGRNFMYSRQCIECKASFSVQPTTLNQLQDVVRFALKNNYHVKAIGAILTVKDTICTDGILVDMREIKHFSFNPEANQATVGAGMELSEFLEAIHNQGRGLTGAPACGMATIGGVVATGSHGTNLKQAATLSDQIVSVTFVDGEGNVRQLKEGDDDFKAMKVNLGLLGIVYEVTVATTEQYKLEMRNFPMSDEILWRGREILDMAESYDNFQFHWFPTNKQIVVMAGNKVPTNTSGNCRSNSIPGATAENWKVVHHSLEQMQKEENELSYFYAQSLAKLSLYEDVPGRLPYYTESDDSYAKCPSSPSVGYSHHIMTSSLNKELRPLKRAHGAVEIDLDEMEGAFQTLKEVTDEHLVGFPLDGMNFRFVKESDAYMGPNRNRPTLQVEWISLHRDEEDQPKLGVAGLQAIAQALVEKHGARPHWAKNGLYYSTHEIIKRAYPDLPKFINAMNRMDPQEIFMNDFGNRLKHGGEDMSLSKAAKLRCGLNDACLCKTDLDCGDGSPSAYVCTDFQGFKVCNKQPTPLNLLKESTSRDMINSDAKLVDDQDYLIKVLAPYNGLRYID